MRIAFVTVGDTSRLTGGYLYHARLFSGLRARGIEIAEIVAGDASLAGQEHAATRLGSLVDLRSIDVVVVDALARVVCAPWLDRWRRARPVVVLVHELPSVAAPGAATAARDRKLEEPLLRADRLVAVSPHGRDILRSRGVPAGRISVAAPGFDRLSPAGGAQQRPTVRGGGPVRALCVAQWIPRKGIRTLVEAWARHERPGATLEFIGETQADPGYAAIVRAAIAAAPNASISVTGPVDDATLKAAFAAADLFVLPSRYEGYGIVYAEALAYGLPVIACRVGPVPKLVGKSAGILVPPDDPAALAGALDLLLRDPELRGRLAAGARRLAARLPRWDDTVACFQRAVEGAIAQRSGRPEGTVRGVKNT